MTLALTLDCPACLALPAQVAATGRPATCLDCGAEYLPPSPSGAPRAAEGSGRTKTPRVPRVTVERPQGDERPGPRPASAARDLEALAQCLTALLGSASPIVKLPGGQSEGSPAERVQGLLGAALRAASRLAWLRQTRPREVLCLLATYVHAGPGRRGQADWPESVSLSLRSRPERVAALASAARAGAGPRAHAARTEGIALLAHAEALYAGAEEQPTDGRWLERDLDFVSRSLRALAKERHAVASARCRPPTRGRPVPTLGTPPVLRVCTALPADLDLCALSERSGLVNAREWGGQSCEGRRGRKRRRCCRQTGRWLVRDGRLVALPLAAERRLGFLHPKKEWGLLVAAAEGR